jgi:hypothetical protein
MEEDLGLPALDMRNQVLIKNVKDILADLGDFGLDLSTGLLNKFNLRGIALGLLLRLVRDSDSP